MEMSRDNSKTFRLQGKQFFLTYPQCEHTKDELLHMLNEKAEVDNYLICRELHEDGNPHLHAYVSFKSKLSTRNPRYFDLFGKHGNYQTVRNKEKTIRYTMKGSDYISNFDPKLKLDTMKNKKRDISKDLIRGKPLHDVVDENPELLFGYARLRNDLNLYKLDKNKPSAIFKRHCLWIHGEPGIGKSYWVRSKYPQVYSKPQNKWWDGYSGQDVVLLDDLDSECLGHNLKIWSDSYSFEAEIKGGTIMPCYTKFIITSNYLPHQLFKDEKMAASVSRRFTICTIENRQLVVSGDQTILEQFI